MKQHDRRNITSLIIRSSRRITNLNLVYQNSYAMNLHDFTINKTHASNSDNCISKSLTVKPNEDTFENTPLFEITKECCESSSACERSIEI